MPRALGGEGEIRDPLGQLGGLSLERGIATSAAAELSDLSSAPPQDFTALLGGSFGVIFGEGEPDLVPRRRVRSPMNTERMSFPKEAALTGSSLWPWQCSR